MVIEAMVHVRLSNYKDDMLQHLLDHKEYILPEARRMYEAHEFSYKKYCLDRLQRLLTKQEADRVKQQVQAAEDELLHKLKSVGLVFPNTEKLGVDNLKAAVKLIKEFHTERYSSLRVSVARPMLVAQLEAVLDPYMRGCQDFVYQP